MQGVFGLSKGRTKGPDAGCAIGDLFRLLSQSHVLDILYLVHQRAAPLRFVELQTELGMSPNTLSARLKALVEAGLLTRTAYNEIPPRVDYAATPKAMELQGVFAQLQGWARKNTLTPLAA